MCILLSLVLFRPCGRGEKPGNKWNSESYETIFWYVPHPGALVWLVVESNCFCCISLLHSKISAQCRLNIWGHSEDFSTSTISSWIFAIPCPLVPALFVGFSIPLILFRPFIMIVGGMVHVNSVKFTLHIMLGAPIPILAISDNIILWFIDSPVFKIVKSLNITLVGVPSFIVGTCMGYVTSSSLKCYKDRSFVSVWLRHESF